MKKLGQAMKKTEAGDKKLGQVMKELGQVMNTNSDPPHKFT